MKVQNYVSDQSSIGKKKASTLSESSAVSREDMVIFNTTESRRLFSYFPL